MAKRLYAIKQFIRWNQLVMQIKDPTSGMVLSRMINPEGSPDGSMGVLPVFTNKKKMAEAYPDSDYLIMEMSDDKINQQAPTDEAAN